MEIEEDEEEDYHDEICNGLHSRNILLEAQLLEQEAEPFELERDPNPQHQLELWEKQSSVH